MEVLNHGIKTRYAYDFPLCFPRELLMSLRKIRIISRYFIVVRVMQIVGNFWIMRLLGDFIPKTPGFLNPPPASMVCGPIVFLSLTSIFVSTSQHTKDVTVFEETKKRLESLQNDKDEMLKNVVTTTTSEKLSAEKIVALERQLTDAEQNSKTAKRTFQEIEKELLGNISSLKRTLEEKTDEIRRIIVGHKEELKQKTELATLEREESRQKYVILGEQDEENTKLVASLKEELRHKTDEVSKCVEECRALRGKEESLCKERSAILREKDDLSSRCESSTQKISHLQEEKSSLSSMVRDNVQDLTRAKTIIDSLQAKLDEREKNLEVYSKQDADLADLLMKKHLVGESLLHERQQILAILEDKTHEIDELKGLRDALAHKLESKIHTLSEVECACRSLETKLDVRSNELEAIMEDRNKLVNNLKTREGELAKVTEERDSLVTLMNGKQSEKEREVNKLITRLKGKMIEIFYDEQNILFISQQDTRLYVN